MRDVVSIPDAGLFEMERVRAKFRQWGLIRGVWCGCSILYNRGVYPEESFAKVKKYGLPMLLTQDDAVKTFLTNLTSQLSGSSSSSEISRYRLEHPLFLLTCICCGLQSGWRVGSCRGLCWSS